MINELNENDYSEWSVKASEFMFQLMKDFPKGFTADEFYQRSRLVKMPAAIIKRLAGKTFKEFQASGYIQKTKQYRLSCRNRSSPLPIWIPANLQAAQEGKSVL